MITRILSLGLRRSKWIFRPWVVIYSWPNYEDNSYALSMGCAQREIKVYIITAKPFSKIPTYWQVSPTQVNSIWKFNPASLFYLYFASATFSSHGGKITYLTEISRRINIWHGIPIKSVGVKRGDNPPTPSGFTLSTSPKGTELMRSMYNKRAPEFLEIGLPRNDLIIHNSKLDSKIRRQVYLPTYRISSRGQSHKDGNEYNNGLCISDRELQELDKILQLENIYLDIFAHPMGNVVLPENLRNISLVDRNSLKSTLYSELGKYDALVSDYSSVIIDYLLCGKPIIVFTPDKLEYLDTRGLNLDISEIPATSFADDIESLVKSIKQVYKVETKQFFVEKWHTFNDFNSTARLLDYFFHANNDTVPERFKSLTTSMELLRASLYGALLGILFPLAVLLTQPHQMFAQFWLIFSITVFTQSVFRTYCENVFAFNKTEMKFEVTTTGTGLAIAIIPALIGFFALINVKEDFTWITLLALLFINLSQYQSELVRSVCIAANALREARLIAQMSLGLHLILVVAFLIFSLFFSFTSESIILLYSIACTLQAMITKKFKPRMHTTGKVEKQKSVSNANELDTWIKSLYGLIPITLGNVIVNYLLVFHNLESSLAFVRGMQVVLTPIAYLSNLQIWTFEIRSGLNELFNRRLTLLSLIFGIPLIVFALIFSHQNFSTISLICSLIILGEVTINLRSNFYQLSIRAKEKLFELGTTKTILALIQVAIIVTLIQISLITPLTFSSLLLLMSLLNFIFLRKSSRES
ncbi:MAG: hypothetical protein EB100_01875 [Crocinitomicaceae bacterium]|nr:hypothetical protein [Crocinitomicaceae bacterium]